MSAHNPYPLYVNQKLAFARYQLASARENLLVEDLQHRLATHACLDASVQQLYQGLLYFVYEIVRQMDVSLDTATYDVKALIERHRAIPEISEMANLLNSPSWLSQFLLAYHDNEFVVRQFNVAAAKQNGDDVTGAASKAAVIPSVQIVEDSPLERIESWAHSLQSLIDRQRESMAEA